MKAIILPLLFCTMLTSGIAEAAETGPVSAPATGPAPVQTMPVQTMPVQPAPPPPTPVDFDKALLKASTDLFTKANLDGFAGNVAVVIDPLIDGGTGARSRATLSEEKRIKDLVKDKFPRFAITPFTPSSVAEQPVVLIGTFTQINNAGVAGGPKDAFRICLALADLKSKKVISKGVARATLGGIDPTPTAFYADSPIFYKDASTDAYVKSCQGSKPGDPLPQTYSDHILAAALISEGIDAYDEKRYRDSLDLYRSALKVPGGEQIRVYNGMYLAGLALNDRKTAREAFDKLIDLGLKGNKLAIKFLFNKNSTIFVKDRGTRIRYGEWLTRIARKTATSKTCLDVVGHTSATGLAAYNERLSELRAKYIEERLEERLPVLRGRLRAAGKGSGEMIVGTGRDDTSDALDRRVELQVAKCGNLI